ncbi:MAG: hypothetical protein QOF01_4158 [Thermomicrobiales bacterium]|nr:hypothetical protein [Thermomicrobiales bacterium]
MGRMWNAGESRTVDEEHERGLFPLLRRPWVHRVEQIVEAVASPLTDVSDRAKISGIGPSKAAWRRSTAVSKP